MKDRAAAIQRAKDFDGIYLGLAELACVLGQTKQATANQMKRGKLPKPIQKLAMSSIWTKHQILQYLKETT